MEAQVDKDLLIAALEESVDLLREENSRYRESNRRLRLVNSGLRQKISELANISEMNDQSFKDVSDAPVDMSEACGLRATSYQVDPLI